MLIKTIVCDLCGKNKTTEHKKIFKSFGKTEIALINISTVECIDICEDCEMIMQNAISWCKGKNK